VQAAANGDYTALLGSTRNEGIPAEAFGSGERWLGIQAQGETERPRVLMTSVPYSLKAVDAETLGGLPASAFALATTPGNGAGRSDAASAKSVAASGSAKPAATPDVAGSGVEGTLALWTGAKTLGTSLFTQTSSGSISIGDTPTEISVGINSISARRDHEKHCDVRFRDRALQREPSRTETRK
jgi:hypothetical protein